MTISSPQNPRIQRVRALLSRRSARDDENAFVLEGVRLTEEAFQAGAFPHFALYSGSLSQRGLELVEKLSASGVEVDLVTDSLLQSLSATETSQGILAVLPRTDAPLPENPSFILILDNLRDPGNAGTILRTASAAGVDVVLLAPGTTDVYAPKVVRAGMGAHFHLSIRALSWPEIKTFCKNTCRPPVEILLTEAEQGIPYWQVDLRRPLALVIGGEAEGVSPQAQQAADRWVTIPMPGYAESLNAATAASVFIYEVVRQRNS